MVGVNWSRGKIYFIYFFSFQKNTWNVNYWIYNSTILIWRKWLFKLILTLIIFPFYPPLFHQTKCKVKRGRDNALSKINVAFIAISFQSWRHCSKSMKIHKTYRAWVLSYRFVLNSVRKRIENQIDWICLCFYDLFNGIENEIMWEKYLEYCDFT